MRKLFNYLFLLPLAIVLILFSVANRQFVQLSFDPLNTQTPALFLELPMFVFIFAVFLLGMLVGGFFVWVSQGRHRKALREKSYEASQLKQKSQPSAKKTENPRPEIAPGLPLVTRN